MKDIYVKAEMEIITFDSEDVIITSPPPIDDGETD